MKIKKLFAIASIALCAMACAEIVGIEVKAGDNPPPGAGRIIAVQGMASGSSPELAKVGVVTRWDREIPRYTVVTNITYRPATSNVQYTATEMLWRAFSTNAYSVATGSVVAVSYVTNIANVVTGTVWSASTGLSNLTHTVTNVVALTNAVPLVRTGINSNLLAQAWGAKPYVANWNTNDLLYVSQSLTRTLSSNVTYQVVDTMDVRTNANPLVTSLVGTNWIVTVEYMPAGLFVTNIANAVVFPGDTLVGAGDYFIGGRVQLLIER